MGYNGSEPLTLGMGALAAVAPVTVSAVLLLAEVTATPASTLPAGPTLSNGSSFALVANATFENWTWTGNPGQGTESDFTAHFLGNASGGSLPYAFLWNFGDRSQNSTLQDPAHTFSAPSPTYY